MSGRQPRGFCSRLWSRSEGRHLARPVHVPLRACRSPRSPPNHNPAGPCPSGLHAPQPPPEPSSIAPSWPSWKYRALRTSAQGADVSPSVRGAQCDVLEPGESSSPDSAFAVTPWVRAIASDWWNENGLSCSVSTAAHRSSSTCGQGGKHGRSARRNRSTDRRLQPPRLGRFRCLLRGQCEGRAT